MATITKRHWHTPKGEDREAWVLSFIDATGRRHREQYAKKRDADAARIRVEGQISVGTFRGDASKLTVKDACDEYLKYLTAREERGEHVTATYLATTKAELQNYVLATQSGGEGEESKSKTRVTPFSEGIGHIRLSQLSSRAVGELAERLRAAGVSVTTTRRAIASLSRALAYAVSKDMVGTNAAKDIRIIGTRKEGPKKIQPPSKAAMKALLKEADPEMYARVLFAASTGLRASEQWALRWRHLDLKSGKVHVETRLDRYGNEDTTKSEAGTRTVPLGNGVIATLDEWRRATKHMADDDLVFPNSKGGYTAHGNFTKRDFADLQAKAKAVGVNWHALRHYAVSTWIEAGLPPKTVQTFAGHATLAITMDRYGHLFPKDEHQNVMDDIAAGLIG